MLDKPYVILGAQTEGLLASEVELYMQRGYQVAGGVSIGRDGRFHQALVKRPAVAPNGEVRLKEPKRR
jgi:hypothetical protein